MTKYITNLVEIQNFGLNAITVSAIATAIFALATVWGLFKQNKLIWGSKSGESIAVPWFICAAFNFYSMFIYGLVTSSGALIFNGFLAGIFYAPILTGLGKFKGFSRQDKIIFSTFTLALLTMIFLPIKGSMYLFFSLATTVALAMQPWEIWKQKSSGIVDIRLILIYFIATSFWAIYSYLLKNWRMEVVFDSALVVLFITILLWFRYHKKEARKWTRSL